ncbi:hypothetical protein BDZ89DRAFT_90238 [Hymenopellis radicata]|nr:hypothetical protein BDZ89DRAFT_90238 [Hymenopellis radicata]
MLDIWSCREWVAHLTAALAGAHRQLASLETLRTAHIQLFPPIHMLPAEILFEIFQLAVDKRPWYAFSKGPWKLGRVCRFWRQIVSAPSTLWSHSSCALSSSPLYYTDDSRAQLSTVFERSSPLSFHYEMDSLGHYLDIVKSHSQRWQNISIFAMPKDYMQLGEVGELPLLETASLVIYNPNRRKACTLAHILDRFQYAPKLQSLKLRVDLLLDDLNPMSSAFPWHQLTHLDVSLSEFGTLSLDYQLLAHCPNLLSYTTDSTREPQSSNAIIHSKLQTLDIKDVRLLHHLRLMHEHNGTAVEDYVSAFRTFLAQSPMLASVEIEASHLPRPIHNHQFISSFTSASIRTLKLGVKFHIEDLVLLTASATPLLVPNMTHFECTSRQETYDGMWSMVHSAIDVVQSRWHVTRNDVAKLEYVRLCFGHALEDDEEVKEKLRRTIDCLRVLKAEGLDIVIFECRVNEFCDNGREARR